MLYVDDGYSGNFNLVYNGIGYPNVLTYTATNLITGLPYRFKLVSYNVNGASPDSSIVTIYSCLKPTKVFAPYKISTTTTSITIGWFEPTSNGCPITGFEIYRDTGNSDGITV
jgi:hypothetical protein